MLGRQYHLITRDDRLETVAQDIVRHFLGRGFVGKAMVVSIDKATALRMHDKVKKHWAAETARVQRELNRYDLPNSEKAALRHRLEVQLLVLNRRQKSAARSTLKLAIEDTLDSGLPRSYTPEIYNQKCFALFEHVYESYPERTTGVYAEVG